MTPSGEVLSTSETPLMAPARRGSGGARHGLQMGVYDGRLNRADATTERRRHVLPGETPPTDRLSRGYQNRFSHSIVSSSGTFAAKSSM